MIGLLDLKLVQLDTNFIKIGEEMAKIDRCKIDKIGHFYTISLVPRFGIFLSEGKNPNMVNHAWGKKEGKNVTRCMFK